jgi:hypothetical protein
MESFANVPVFVERAMMGAGECYERLNDRTRAREMFTKVLETTADPQVKKDAEERLRRMRR